MRLLLYDSQSFAVRNSVQYVKITGNFLIKIGWTVRGVMNDYTSLHPLPQVEGIKYRIKRKEPPDGKPIV